MSIAAMQWVWEHSPSQGHDRLTLVLIADESDELGMYAHPSQRRLARRVNAGQTTIRRCIDRLEGAGELLVKRPEKVGPGKHSRYCLVMGRDPHTLADQLGWPEPRLDAEIRREWEQLALDRSLIDGPPPRAAAEAPYPVGDPPGDNPVDEDVDKPQPRRTAPNRATQGGSEPRRTAPHSGADPLTLTSDPQSGRQQPTEDQTRAVRDRDARARDAAVPMPTALKDRLKRGEATDVSSMVPGDPDMVKPPERDRADLA